MKVKRDQITGLALVLLGLGVTYMVMQFKVGFSAEYPGPKLFPIIAVFGFIVCGLGIFLGSTFGKKEEKVFLVKAGWAKVGITFGLLAAYVAILKYLGYLVTTPFILFAICTLFARGKESSRKSRIIFAVAFTVLVYVIYVYAFGLKLPGGLLLR